MEEDINIISEGIERIATIEELQSLLNSSDIIAIKLNGQLKDLSDIPEANSTSTVELISSNSKEGLQIYRHSASHILAHAVKELFPDAKFAIGPSTEEGFYYDIDMSHSLTPEDLQGIEKKMTEIIKKNQPFIKKTLNRQEAIDLFKSMGEIYKVELLQEITDDEVSIYQEGSFVDLCRGPHIPKTGRIKAFKLLNIAGAYWRGNEKNKMLQRIYGTAFATKDELKSYLDFLEEVKKRDHRRLAKELDLFSINDDIGPGLILWHPNGAIIRKTIEDFWRDEHIKANYQILYTPHIARLNLWQMSGHLDFYRENMYSPMDIDEIAYELKPMNCPFHISIYKSSLKSYRQLPIRFAELGTVYRYERSGVLHGLMRVRGFTQDDAHIFCREDQLEDEILKILDFTLFILQTFGFSSFDIYLSTRPEKYVGSLENWEKATEALKKALHSKSLKYEIDPGEGVFYGPKIDIKIKDSLNRSWQCSTIQVDFNLPERFDVTYRASDGKSHRPIMIHRALMGSLERFFGVLVEHYAGAFPLWLSPIQAIILTISEKVNDFATEVFSILRQKGIRVELNNENEKIGFKIREATVRKIPYLVIIGEKEAQDKLITVRLRKGDNLPSMPVDTFADLLNKEIKNKE